MGAGVPGDEAWTLEDEVEAGQGAEGSVDLSMPFCYVHDMPPMTDREMDLFCEDPDQVCIGVRRVDV